MNVASIIALTILISLLQIGCSPVKVSLNSEFGVSLGKTPSEDDQPDALAEITITSQPPFLNANNSSSFTLDGSCKNLEKIDIKINGSNLSNANCNEGQWQITLDSSSEPDGNVVITLIDPESLQTLKTLNLEKDVAWPIALLSSSIPSLNNSNSIVVSITEMIGSVQFSYKVGQAVSTDCSSPSGYSSYITTGSNVLENLSNDGNYRLCLLGKDSFENEQPYAMATVLNWQLDTAAPAISFVSSISNTYINSLNKTAFSIGVSCSEANQMVKFIATDKNDLELSSVESCSASNLASYVFNTSTLAEGQVNFFVIHKDAAGNTTPATLVLNVNKDTTPPAFADPYISDGNYYSSLTSSPPITWTAATDTGGSGVADYQIGFGTSSVSANTRSLFSIGMVLSYQFTFSTTLTEGTMYHTFIKVYDAAGNYSLQVSDGWIPDVTAPTISSMDDGIFSGAGSTPMLSWAAASDGAGGSGIYRYEISIGSSAGGLDILSWTSAGSSTTLTTGSTSIALGGTYYGSVRAIDNAGNVGVKTMGDGFFVKPLFAPNNIVSNYGAFAGIMTNGKVVCWGDPSFGGNYAALPTLLKSGVLTATKIVSSAQAFAAIMSNGSVITWGASSHGGDSTVVANSLDGTIDVVSISATQSAFAALRADGSVIVWGNNTYGETMGAGESAALNGTIPVTSIQATASAFAALRSNGSVITWGYNGGDSSTVTSDIDGSIPVVAVYSTSSIFIAQRSNGSLITWGYHSSGILPSAVASDISGVIPVTTVVTNSSSVAALRSDGSVITWGNTSSGGDSSTAASRIDGTIDVVKLYSNNSAFAALRADGSVVAWGSSTAGGDNSYVSAYLTGSPNQVIRIARTSGAFAALRDNGSVITWGAASLGGALGSLPASAIDGSIPVTSISGNHYAFAAIRSDGSLVAWGNAGNGGDTGSAASKLDGVAQNVVALQSNTWAFAAVLDNGELVTWGDATYGGDSSAINP